MSKTFLVITLLILSSTSTFAVPMVTMTIRQDAINQFWAAVGPLKGPLTVNGSNCTWTVDNPRMTISAEGVDFFGDTGVQCGAIRYPSSLSGKASVTYDDTQNIMSVKITRVILETHMDLFGQKIHLADLDLASLYGKYNFKIAAPQLSPYTVSVAMPDGTNRILTIRQKPLTLLLEDERILLGSDLAINTD
jgi:hypothetical protein